ncbi:hypothetical protein ES703_04700 [subsurface metagenome]
MGTNKNRIIEESMKILEGNRKCGKIYSLWDGEARKRIVNILRKVGV